MHCATVEVDVEEVAVGARLEIDRPGYRCSEDLRLGRVAIDERPDAFPRVVGEEERTVVPRRIGVAAVEREPGDRAARCGTAHRSRPMAVVVQRLRHRARGGVERLTEVEVDRIEGRLGVGALVARPAEVPDGRRIGDIQLLPGVHPDVAGVDGARPGLHRDPEGVPQSVRDDALRVRVACRVARVGRQRGAGRRIDADDRPVETGGITRRSNVLRAQGAAFRGRR